MPMLYIICPKTGTQVSTGISVPAQELKTNPQTLRGNSFDCPACGETHTWNGEEAMLAKQPWER